MTFRADLFWSFRSPYSYLALQRWRDIVGEYDLTINLRPIYPIAVRQPDFFERSHPNYLRYTTLDVRRVAERMGVTLIPPHPDPIEQTAGSRRIPTDQPLIRRLVRTCQAAARRGRSFDYADEVSRLIWGGVEGWNGQHYLTAAARRAGLDFAELEAEAEADPIGLDRDVAANQAVLEEAGHWGVPTLVFQNEPFFGQDRIDLALWRMKQAGLERR
ncbi:2-hydroxychromene-2-carboxylate isomerase [Sphingomonas koreensis]|nr:2-hydroxychromene-2-carboxylate isomerase [Sphingomonas koreensis]